MRIRTGWIPFLAILAVAFVLMFTLAGCNLADPATWMLITPEAPDSDAIACDRHRTLATLRAAVPYENSTLYFTGRAEDSGDIVYGLTFWFVEPKIPLQGEDGDVQATVLDTVNRAAPVMETMLAADPCVAELYDLLLLAVVDSEYNSWYLGNTDIAELAAGVSADTLLSSPEMLLPETWPEAAGELPDGSCTWAEATATMEACTGENGGCVLALTEQMGPIAVAQTLLPMPLAEWFADRDRDMALAEAAMAGMECLHPPAYSKVMNFVTEDGDLLFAGEWSGSASQVSYSQR